MINDETQRNNNFDNILKFYCPLLDVLEDSNNNSWKIYLPI